METLFVSCAGSVLCCVCLFFFAWRALMRDILMDRCVHTQNMHVLMLINMCVEYVFLMVCSFILACFRCAGQHTHTHKLIDHFRLASTAVSTYILHNPLGRNSHLTFASVLCVCACNHSEIQSILLRSIRPYVCGCAHVGRKWRRVALSAEIRFLVEIH